MVFGRQDDAKGLRLSTGHPRSQYTVLLARLQGLSVHIVYQFECNQQIEIILHEFVATVYGVVLDCR